MKLYHGTKRKLKQIEPRQAQSGGNTEIPKDELLNAIYLTPDYGRAVAMGSRPEGKTEFDDKNHKITFENPKLFNPDDDVYIYSYDSEMIGEDKLKLGDNGFDYTVNDISKEIKPEFKKIKAREVLNFYELTNWKENDVKKNEIWRLFKMR